MALQIANPAVVGKVERLAKRTRRKTAVVERAVDRHARRNHRPVQRLPARVAALLSQLDRIPVGRRFRPVAVGRTRVAQVIVADTSAIVAMAFAEPSAKLSCRPSSVPTGP